MIRVCDAIMGSGKSSAAITYMNEHSDERFVYITPYIDEAARIKACCPALRFVEPSDHIAEYGFTKTGHTRELLREGCNVATTHQAFLYYTQEMLEQIREKGYTLIIDENVNVLEEYAIKAGDLEVLVRSGCVRKDGDKYELADQPYSGEIFKGAFRFMKSRELVSGGKRDGESLFYWALPPALIGSFRDVFVLTYLFEGQDIHHFLEMHRIPYQYIGVVRDGDGTYRFSETEFGIPSYVRTLRDRIHIFDDKKLNAVGDDKFALSMNWFNKPGNAAKLKRDIYNYFRNIMGDDTSEKRMWSTYDGAKGALRGKGYTKKFVIFNERATNKYRDRTVLAYAVNLFMNASRKYYYRTKGVEPSDDIYALSNMVQWIWRSAIRDGKDIWIYLPSRRMRDLLMNWIERTEQQYKEYIVTKGGMDHDE